LKHKFDPKNGAPSESNIDIVTGKSTVYAGQKFG
jgi:hypothetical protein